NRTVPTQSKPTMIPSPESSPLESAVSSYLLDKLRSRTGGAVSPSDMGRNFMDFGVDSAGIISLARELGEELQIEVYPTLFFEYPNLEELKTYLLTEHSKEVNHYFSESLASPSLSS
ncbi:acyl carrier protein, partial [Fulvivirga kasyanovii]|nr:acyl carrier protein [Fulvivirga kasyanovii]